MDVDRALIGQRAGELVMDAPVQAITGHEQEGQPQATEDGARSVVAVAGCRLQPKKRALGEKENRREPVRKAEVRTPVRTETAWLEAGAGMEFRAGFESTSPN